MRAATTPVARVIVAERSGAANGDSQDRVFTLPNAVVVLDGASSPQPQERDGGWYANVLGSQFVRELRRHPLAVDSPRILASAIDVVARTYGLVPGSSPSSTVAMLRWDHEQAEALVLGDSPALALRRDGQLEQLRDDRLDKVATTQRRAYQTRLAQGGGYDEEHRKLLCSLVQAQQHQRNRDDGYWIAEADPSAAYQAQTRRWPSQELDRVLLLTDGVAIGVEEYGCIEDWPQILAVATPDDLQAILYLVHATEDKDPHGQRWPRSKRHDDKAAALVAFTHRQRAT